MKNKDIQHFQASKDVIKNTSLNLNDLAVYLKIGKYMNKDTKEAYPSLQTIASDTNLSLPTIRSSIKKLVNEGAIKVERVGRLNHYVFLQHDLFEKFGHKFLDNENLTAQEMAFIAKVQPYMLIDNNEGKVKYTNSQLSELTGLSISSIKRYNKALEQKNMAYVDISEKTYYLDELGQFVLYAIKNLNDRVSALEKKQLSDEELERLANILIKKQNTFTL